MPSAQIAVRRLFSTVPPVPDAQKPDSTCWAPGPVATQFVPLVSIAPPPPSTVSRLVESESRWKFCTVQEVRLEQRAPSGVLLGSGTSR